MLDYFNQSILEERPVVLNLYIDEDEPDQHPWTEHFDPSMDLIFGKYGLSESLWRGNSIFNDYDSAPDVVRQALYNFADSERERIQMEFEQEMVECDEERELPQFDARLVVDAHLETLKNEVLIQITLFSKTKFS